MCDSFQKSESTLGLSQSSLDRDVSHGNRTDRRTQRETTLPIICIVMHVGADTEDGFEQRVTGEPRKRSIRACDLCRKAKIRCNRSSEDEPCQACQAAEVGCVFSGPTFKRGPPKGYIQALEQRWYRSESILAVLIAASSNPYVQELSRLLQQDDLAREVMESVATGPLQTTPEAVASFERKGVKQQNWGSGKIVSQHASFPRNPKAPYRQCNTSRQRTQSTTPLTPLNYIQWIHPLNRPNLEDKSASPDDSGVDEAIDGLNHLSVDENQELRYHGSASGYHLLGAEERFDGRNEGGIWKFPMARVWPLAMESRLAYADEDDVDVQMPPPEQQEALVNVYFTYIHPFIPLIHKQQFLESFRASRQQPSGTQGLSKGLLLGIFAIAERYRAATMPPPPEGVMSEAGCDFAYSAQEVIMKTVHHSHPVTCQALLLLGVREFAIGKPDQCTCPFSLVAWSALLMSGTGMAIRMAYDLGLNRDPEHWLYRGREVFTVNDKQTRRAIWWACCSVDRRMSAFLGRPISIQDKDYNVKLPDPEAKCMDTECLVQIYDGLWQPVHEDPAASAFSPVSGHFAQCYHYSASLSIIMGQIINTMYPVKRTHLDAQAPSQAWQAMSAWLHQWYGSLPKEMQYLSVAQLADAPPHIMLLHVEYWYATLLLHRSLLPSVIRPESLQGEGHIIRLERCHAAAMKISDIVGGYHDRAGLDYSPPFLSSYVLNAGITHVITLSVGVMHEAASQGLLRAIKALEAMKVCWSGAGLACDLLKGVKLRLQTGGHAPITPASTPAASTWTTSVTASSMTSMPEPVTGRSGVSWDMWPDPYEMTRFADPFSAFTMAQMLGLDVSQSGMDTDGMGQRSDYGSATQDIAVMSGSGYAHEPVAGPSGTTVQWFGEAGNEGSAAAAGHRTPTCTESSEG
ncbi:hypothetical protein GLOTRDRAFT_94337 [Gloeophyllum trabeum ATCC 11539]|uniref:Zn(2)-C6 fungal-type domain-containing protein n=1 Tax=Gloeophyllum trabeum (strain ATCC 11539 / FP-39264 / Madison 617) TaxID=670483 RepID=S7Q2Z9_GLOTA|nr:uncharacterized protein GLOTRDRAFT_94337 [Gloeophyllum trabeum ATCC 11539]EPQ54381.1 hypothetical protein GLOTRDRAFT_94337 [Gloeophyllum trabeum ATCC 11539]